MCEIIDLSRYLRHGVGEMPTAVRPADLIAAARRQAAETDEVIRVIEAGDLGDLVALRDALQARL